MTGGAPQLRALVQYGFLGAPLAFAALPLYVLLPAHHAQNWGLPLTGLGLLLMAVRVTDALVDPWLGRWVDRAWTPDLRLWRRLLLAGALVMAVSFAALWWAPEGGWRTDAARTPTGSLWVWVAGTVVLTTLSYSLLSVLHQAWGARRGGGDAAQARWISAREGAALLGVVMASVLPSVVGLGWTSVLLALLMGGGVLGLQALTQPTAPPEPSEPRRMAASARQPEAEALGVSPWRNPAFRALMAVFVVNGLASAIPATLVLFFIRDRLQGSQAEAALLALYFACAMVSLPVWLQAVTRWGLVRVWGAGMALALAAFAFAWRLEAGEVVAFAAICAATGLALGADLVAPAALLVRAMATGGHQGRGEGRYFGWWALANKANLALAAGLALPLLSVWGYTPGRSDAQGLVALSAVYAGLPCALKALALVLWWTLLYRRTTR